jgi:hypothetical protein
VRREHQDAKGQSNIASTNTHIYLSNDPQYKWNAELRSMRRPPLSVSLFLSLPDTPSPLILVRSGLGYKAGFNFNCESLPSQERSHN